MSAPGSSEASACRVDLPYLGCFVDRVSFDEDRGMTAWSKMGDDASPEECRQRCSGYNYMGLQYLDTCMCGNEYGGYGTVEDQTSRSAVIKGGDLEDLDDLETKIKFYLNNPTLRKQIAQAGQEAVSKFDRLSWAKKIIELYHENK